MRTVVFVETLQWQSCFGFWAGFSLGEFEGKALSLAKSEWVLAAMWRHGVDVAPP